MKIQLSLKTILLLALTLQGTQPLYAADIPMGTPVGTPGALSAPSIEKKSEKKMLANTISDDSEYINLKSRVFLDSGFPKNIVEKAIGFESNMKSAAIAQAQGKPVAAKNGVLVAPSPVKFVGNFSVGGQDGRWYVNNQGQIGWRSANLADLGNAQGPARQMAEEKSVRWGANPALYTQRAMVDYARTLPAKGNEAQKSKLSLGYAIVQEMEYVRKRIPAAGSQIDDSRLSLMKEKMSKLKANISSNAGREMFSKDPGLEQALNKFAVEMDHKISQLSPVTTKNPFLGPVPTAEPKAKVAEPMVSKKQAPEIKKAPDAVPAAEAPVKSVSKEFAPFDADELFPAGDAK